MVTYASPSRWASRAALYPVPAPISSTASPSSTSSSVSIFAISEGWLLDESSSPSRTRVASGASAYAPRSQRSRALGSGSWPHTRSKPPTAPT